MTIISSSLKKINKQVILMKIPPFNNLKNNKITKKRYTKKQY